MYACVYLKTKAAFEPSAERRVGTNTVDAKGKKKVSYSFASFEVLTFDATVAFMSCSSV